MAVFLNTQRVHFQHPSGDGREQKIQYKVFSACLGGEQPISFPPALMGAGCDRALFRRNCNGYSSNCVLLHIILKLVVSFILEMTKAVENIVVDQVKHHMAAGQPPKNLIGPL